MTDPTQGKVSPKVLRLSVVALAAAVMAVVWAILDEISGGNFNPVIVSSVTSLVMLVAQFIDWKRKQEGADIFTPEDGD